jgi:FHA domain
MLRRMSFWLLLLFCTMLLTTAHGFAQSGLQGRLSQINPGSFPEISAYLTVYDSEGRAVPNLQPTDVRVLENGQVLPVQSLEFQEPGVQFVVAVNPGPSFAIRDSNGISRYDQVAEALNSWITSTPPSAQDDLSLLTTTGPRASHLVNPSNWQQAFEGYQPDARNITPSFDILNEAISLAADTPSRTGMGKAVLFITPPPEGDAAPALQNLTTQANQQGVRVYVWMIASPAMFDTLGATQLAELAFETGGSTVRFSGNEDLPPVASYLDPLRGGYQLTYLSSARSSGEYQIAAQIITSAETISTEPLPVSLEVAPPNPVFMLLPTTIERKAPDNEQAGVALVPTSQQLQILIEFSDGHPRDLEYTQLIVDGELVAENTESPFDTFTWDLTAYDSNSDHTIKAIVQDSLGLSGESIETPVHIKIAGQPSGVAAVLVERAPMIAVLAALAAGAVLLWVLVVGGRLRPLDATQPRNGRQTTRRKTRRLDKDPVTQPVPIQEDDRRRSFRSTRLATLASRLRWPQRSASNRPLAYLERLGTNGRGDVGLPQPVTSPEITFGSAKDRVSNLLDDASVSDLHAKLQMRTDGEFWIFDAGSVAGTWVNYAQVGEDGQRLKHGDLFHIGRVGFRFKLPDETHARRIVITREETLH